MIKNKILHEINEHQKVVNMIDDELIKELKIVSEEILLAFENGNKILICGNGGSAADAQHFSTELSCRYKKDRKALSAISLATDTSVLTAVSNDISFDNVFKRQVEALAKTGDIVVAISTSGNSRNIINALDEAKKQNCKTVAFTGDNTLNIESVSDYLLGVPSKNTPRIQEIHILFIHIICQLIDDKY